MFKRLRRVDDDLISITFSFLRAHTQAERKQIALIVEEICDNRAWSLLHKTPAQMKRLAEVKGILDDRAEEEEMYQQKSWRSQDKYRELPILSEIKVKLTIGDTHLPLVYGQSYAMPNGTTLVIKKDADIDFGILLREDIDTEEQVKYTHLRTGEQIVLSYDQTVIGRNPLGRSVVIQDEETYLVDELPTFLLVGTPPFVPHKDVYSKGLGNICDHLLQWSCTQRLVADE